MVHFLEMTGDDAESTLRSLARRCRARGDRTELLVSTDDPGRLLLVCRGQGPGDVPDASVRRWSFRSLPPEDD